MAASDVTGAETSVFGSAAAPWWPCIAIGGWFGAISPQLSSASSLRDQASSADQDENIILRAKVDKLGGNRQSQRIDVGASRTALAALPFDSGLPAFTRQLSNQATQRRDRPDQHRGRSISRPPPPPSAGTAPEGWQHRIRSAAGNMFAIPITSFPPAVQWTARIPQSNPGRWPTSGARHLQAAHTCVRIADHVRRCLVDDDHPALHLHRAADSTAPGPARKATERHPTNE